MDTTIFAQQSLMAYAVGVIMAYFGLSAFHVLNQNLVYRISAEARSRINSIYMTLYFGGALGSFYCGICMETLGMGSMCCFRFSDGNVKFLD